MKTRKRADETRGLSTKTRMNLEELMIAAELKSFKQFSNLLDMARNFGDNVVREKLKHVEGPLAKADKDDVLTLIHSGIKKQSNDIDDTVRAMHREVQNRLEPYHPGRAKPTQDNDNRLEASQEGPAQRLLEAKWNKNRDEAADPKVRRDAAIRQAVKNIQKDPQSFTEQYKNVVRAEAEYRLALKMRNAPRPGKKMERPTPL